MRFWASTYGLSFCPDFSKLFLKIEKIISFMGIYIFQSVPGNKSYAQVSSKQGRGGSRNIFAKF